MSSIPSIGALNLGQCSWRAHFIGRRHVNSHPEMHVIIGRVVIDPEIIPSDGPISHLDIARYLLPGLRAALASRGITLIEEMTLEIVPDDSDSLAAEAAEAMEVEALPVEADELEAAISALTPEQRALLVHISDCPDCSAAPDEPTLCAAGEDLARLGYIRSLGIDSAPADAFTAHIQDCPWCAHAYQVSESDSDLCAAGRDILENPNA